MRWILAFFLVWCPMTVFAQEPGWKIGDSVTLADLPEGVSYEGATLSRVEPDSITIMHSAGVAKIPLSKLSPEAQAKFGYDPEKAEFYAMEQEYLAEIARLKKQVADLQNKLAAQESVALETKTTASSEALPQPTQAGFNAFVEEQRNLSGTRQIKGGSSKGGARYTQGPWRGKTEGEGMELAIRQWETFSYEKKMSYERRAEFYGNVVSTRRDSDSSSGGSNMDGPYHVTPGGTVTTPDGKAYHVGPGGVVIPLNP